MRRKFCHFRVHWAVVIRVWVNYLGTGLTRKVVWMLLYTCWPVSSQNQWDMEFSSSFLLAIPTTFSIIFHLMSLVWLLLLEWKLNFSLSVRWTDSVVGSCNWPFVITRCREQEQGHLSSYTHGNGALRNFGCPLDAIREGNVGGERGKFTQPNLVFVATVFKYTTYCDGQFLQQ